jgi:transcriptional regulator with XRE-family HTH domain
MATTTKIDTNAARVARMLMARDGLTGADLAHQLGIPESSVSRRLRGKTPFTFHEIADMADLFDVSPSMFFSDPARAFRTGTAGLGAHSPDTEVPFMADFFLAA